jgi:antitoxin (DNA-binding transcriptional repressor) of toxin-antitoxin stability system
MKATANTRRVPSQAHRKTRKRASESKPGRAAGEVVNIAVAKARLPELVERAAGGEVIILARAGKPRARLAPLDDDRKALRVPGKGKGRFSVAEGFDDPLPPEVLDLFDGGPA